jgi:hypothetical protein
MAPTKDLKEGETVLISGGKYRGKMGVFRGYTGMLSCKVSVAGELKTIRVKSLSKIKSSTGTAGKNATSAEVNGDKEVQLHQCIEMLQELKIQIDRMEKKIDSLNS